MFLSRISLTMACTVNHTSSFSSITYRHTQQPARQADRSNWGETTEKEIGQSTCVAHSVHDVSPVISRHFLSLYPPNSASRAPATARERRRETHTQSFARAHNKVVQHFTASRVIRAHSTIIKNYTAVRLIRTQTPRCVLCDRCLWLPSH